MAPSPFRYEQLQTSTSARILRLHPDRDRLSPRLRCDIVPFDLNRSALPNYEALSYVWGSDEKPCKLEIADHGEVSVTQSLYDALRDMREEDRPRNIWADAVCINQADIPERNAQVLLMDKLYRNARKVITYIAAGTESRYRGLLLAPELYSFVSKYYPKPPDPRIRDLEKLQELGLPNQHDPRWNHLQDVYKLPWSSRMWIVQESLLNENVVMQCGKLQLPWDLLGQIEILSLQALVPEIAVPKSSEYMGLGKNFTGSHPSPLGVMSALRKSAKQEFLQNETLQLLLQNTRYLACTDPRDKIYALLNIAQDQKVLQIKPDYGLPVEDVYKDAAAQTLRKTKNLDLLSSIGPKKRHRLPSWTPDWTVNYNTLLGPTVAIRKGLYRASNDTESNCKYDTASSSMIVQGAIIDHIKKTNGIIWPNQIQRNKPWIEDQIQMAAELRPYGTLGAGKNAFWRTLIANVAQPEGLQQPSEANDSYTAYFDAYTKLQDCLARTDKGETVQILDTEYDKAMRFQFSMARVCADRTFCTTEKGYLAMAVKGVSEGDLVAILAGGKVPYILREAKVDKESPRNEGQQCYEIVGDAYVHGVMNGEALKSGDVKFADITLV